VLALCARDPVANVFVAGRVETAGVDSGRTGGRLWGYFERGNLVSACWAGANIVPVEATPAAVQAFAEKALSHGRRCSSLVGPAPAVLDLWRLLEPEWGMARDVRPVQPLMQIDTDSPCPADPRVRLSTRDDLDLLLPACIAMFTEEVGYSPVTGDSSGSYEARVRQLVDTRRSFVRIDDVPGQGREIVFKAELGAVSRRVAQVQGVWVAPRHRGRGLTAPGMAAVVAATRRTVVPTVSLYVNDYNDRALAAYRRAGFHRVGTFATVLF
jgi:predicted GNAT family acetyltransferase